VVKVLIYIQMLFIFSTPVLIRHLWQLKTVFFLHWCQIRGVPLFSDNMLLGFEISSRYELMKVIHSYCSLGPGQLHQGTGLIGKGSPKSGTSLSNKAQGRDPSSRVNPIGPQHYVLKIPKCQACSKYFIDKEDLKKHIKSGHAKEPNLCLSCGLKIQPVGQSYSTFFPSSLVMGQNKLDRLTLASLFFPFPVL
jgi:Zinc-finger double-stranded RNA-binding